MARHKAQRRRNSCSSGVVWSGGRFRQRQRLPHGIDHADFTIFSTLSGDEFFVLVNVTPFPGRLILFFLFFCFVFVPLYLFKYRAQPLYSTVVAASVITVSAETSLLAAV